MRALLQRGPCGAAAPRTASCVSKSKVDLVHAGPARPMAPALCPCPARASPSSGRSRHIAMSAPTPETEEQRSPLDAPQEWEPPAPSKRPDIFPEFDKPERVILPKMPLPGDPEMPDEELEETSRRTVPGDPDPENKPGEPPMEPEKPPEPGQTEPERKTDIPSSPE